MSAMCVSVASSNFTMNANLYEAVEQQIVNRYIVEKRNSGFWPYCVRAVGGEQELFAGHRNACESVRQALQTACLDGAYMAELASRSRMHAVNSELVQALQDALSYGVMGAGWVEEQARAALASAEASA